MLFNSYSFLLFFPIVIIGFFLLPRKLRAIWMLAASYYFYMAWNVKYVVLLGGVTLLSYGAGILLKKIQDNKPRKRVMTTVVAILLAILFVFKYYMFFAENIGKILKTDGCFLFEINILLPVGISFFTFQAISYIVDVYRNSEEAEENPVYYALYISFFPQLVAGPIERGQHLISQLRVSFEKSWKGREIANNFFHGSVMMLQGFFIKIVIADKAAILVDTVFNSYYQYGSIELILAAVLFALQIYCDFNGYTLIAIGAARFLGIHLLENFNTPYFSKSITEFWRRWHISLSGWFRDYVYIPLGGSRCSKAKQARNNVITMLLSGIWHGAGWNYIVWGLLHGIIMVLEKTFRRKSSDNRISNRMLKTFTTCIGITITWIFFRASTFRDALFYIWRMATKWNVWALTDGTLYTLGLSNVKLAVLMVSAGILFCFSIIKYKKNMNLSEFLLSQPVWFRMGVIFVLGYMILCFGEYGSSAEKAQFIYFQF